MAKITNPITDNLMTVSTVQTANYTAKDFEHILCDTTASAFTVTLPASPTVDSKITITDVANSFGTNNLTISPNGKNIDNQASDIILNKSQSVTYYYDSTNGWIKTSATDKGSGLTNTTIKTANYTANDGELVLCDTTGGQFTITLPAVATDGMKVGVLDIVGNFGTNSVIVDPGTNEMLGVVDTIELNINRTAITFVAVDNAGTVGWHIVDSIPTTGNSGLAVTVVVRNLLGTASNYANFGEAIVDDTNSYDLATGTFTAPISGWYSVGGELYSSAPGNIYCRGVVNGVIDNSRSIGGLYSNYGVLSDLRYLNQGDTYRVYIDGSSFSASTNHWLSIHKVFNTANIRGNANLDYSTTETDTGTTWIDGKAIYRKVVNIGTVANGGSSVAHGITGIDRVINYWGISDNGTNQFVLMRYTSTADDYIYIGDTNVFFNVVAGSCSSVYVILEYTKI